MGSLAVLYGKDCHKKNIIAKEENNLQFINYVSKNHLYCALNNLILLIALLLFAIYLCFDKKLRVSKFKTRCSVGRRSDTSLRCRGISVTLAIEPDR